MTEIARSYLDLAQRAIASARRELEAGEVRFAADRVYFAMFYAATALLEPEGLRFRKHSAVVAAFGARFVSTGRIAPIHHARLRRAFNLRQDADYDTMAVFSAGRVRQAMDEAEELVGVVKATLPAPGEER